MSIELHILRHGQATHNLPNALEQQHSSNTKLEAEKQHFDALLTERGQREAQAASPPFDWQNTTTEFWVSPLRRAVQTACLAMPHVRSWRVMEDLRERAGEKYCDSRQSKTELIKWCTQTFPDVTTWNFDGIVDEEDVLFAKSREDAQRIRYRAYSAICEMINRSSETGIRQFVWVSHSCFLSVLLALLNRCRVEQRWLNNGEWRSLKLDLNTVKQYAHQRLLVGIPRPVIGFLLPPEKNSSGEGEGEKCFEYVDWCPLVYDEEDRCMPSYRNHISLYSTRLSLTEAIPKLTLFSKCLVVLKYPLPGRGNGAVAAVADHPLGSLIDPLVKHLRGQLEELVKRDPFELYECGNSVDSATGSDFWRDYVPPEDATPPFVEESQGWVAGLVGQGGVADASMERMGMICNNECLVVFEKGDAALKNVLRIAERLMGTGGANNVTVLECGKSLH